MELTTLLIIYVVGIVVLVYVFMIADPNTDSCGKLVMDQSELDVMVQPPHCTAL